MSERRRRTTHPRNGAGQTALMTGVVALVCAFVPIVGELVAIPAAIAAIGLGLLGLARVEAGLATNWGESVAGLVLGLLAAMVVLLMLLATTG